MGPAISVSTLPALFAKSAEAPPFFHIRGVRAIERVIAEPRVYGVEPRVQSSYTRVIEETELSSGFETRERYPDEPHRTRAPTVLVLRERVAQELTAHPVDREIVVGRRRQGALARACLEWRHAQLQRDGLPTQLLSSQPLADALGETKQRRLHGRRIERVAIERVLVTHGLRGHVWLDRALIDPVGALPDRTSVLPESHVQRGDVGLREVADGAKTPALEQLARLRADGPPARELERREERGLATGSAAHQAVGLAQIRADLRAELVGRDANGDDQSELRTHLRLQVLRDLHRATEQMLGGGHVEEGLVERDRLHQRRPDEEQRHDRVRCLLIGLAVTRHEDPVRAQTARDAQRHRGAHSESARLVLRGTHHGAVVQATATEHLLSANLWR